MTKRNWLTGFLVCSGFIFAQAVFAAEVITDFSVRATLEANRHLVIEEAIAYDFGENERHGIFRFIPVISARTGGRYDIRLRIEQVTRDGSPEPFESTRDGRHVKLKIGSADRTLSGRHLYRLRYATDRAINFFDDGHSELYWNVTGNEWPVSIERASFALTLFSGSEISAASSTCDTGEFGSTENACHIATSANGFSVTTTRVLVPDEGLTVAFAFPPGLLRAPTMFERVWYFFSDNVVLFFPLAALFFMHWLWWKKGRDPARMTVIPEYAPPRKLSPALIGAAMTNGEVPSKIVTATILDLARRGFLKIHFDKERGVFGAKNVFRFIKQQPKDASATPYESSVLEGLFVGGDEQTLQDLNAHEFYEAVASFKHNVEDQIDSLKIFVANPNSVRGIYLVSAMLIGVLLMVTIGSTLLGVLSALLTGMSIAGYGIFMPKRTISGVKLLAEIEGFKWFLSVTEKDRLAFTDAPERTPEQFHKFLPYAIALGVEEQWAKQFASLTIPPPTWAEGNLSDFTALWLISNLDTMHSTAQSLAYAAPSQAGAGGSGFSGGGSGGGFGGGGGGSW